MKRYVQSHTVPGPVSDALRASRGAGPAFDGITEVWFDSLEAMGASTEAARSAGEALLRDEAEFLDFESSAVFVTVEHEVFS